MSPEPHKKSGLPQEVRMGLRERTYTKKMYDLPWEGPIPSYDVFVARLKQHPQDLKDGIDLNTARLDQLMAAGLPEVDALRIILARRDKKFERVEDLLAVDGITPFRVESIRSHVRVGPRSPDQNANR
jgi:DNA uptake protein ComE-like DNA-binding protein